MRLRSPGLVEGTSRSSSSSGSRRRGWPCVSFSRSTARRGLGILSPDTLAASAGRRSPRPSWLPEAWTLDLHAHPAFAPRCPSCWPTALAGCSGRGHLRRAAGPQGRRLCPVRFHRAGRAATLARSRGAAAVRSGLWTRGCIVATELHDDPPSDRARLRWALPHRRDRGRLAVSGARAVRTDRPDAARSGASLATDLCQGPSFWTTRTPTETPAGDFSHLAGRGLRLGQGTCSSISRRRYSSVTR